MERSLDPTVASILRARRERRWTDASQQLEKWVANCRRQAPVSVPEMVPANSGVGPMGMRMFTARRFGRQGSVDDEDEQRILSDLRERLPKVRKLLEKESAQVEQPLYMVVCNKHNTYGKVQARLLVVSDQAVYNTSVDAKKCKRRIPLAHISLVTTSEPTGQIVLHVPAEYDYHFSVPARGYSPPYDALADGAPLAGLLEALERAHAGVMRGALPIRTDGGHLGLGSLVQKKKRGGDEAGGTLAYSLRDDDDDDDDE